ncbi:MAG: EFR1 family ferrodoxin [Elusimicrobiota bacterium]
MTKKNRFYGKKSGNRNGNRITKTVLYYFTGTGNTLSVAKKLANELGNTEICSIVKALKNNDFRKADRIGILSPVYVFDIPNIVRDFIETLPADTGDYYFAVCTTGEMPDGVLGRISELFGKKGIKLSAAYYVPMPGNAIMTYNVWSEDRQKKLFEDAGDRIKQIAAVVREKKEDRINKGSFFTNIISIIPHYIFTKIFFKKFDKDFWVDDKCNSCGICEKVCPSGNLKMKDHKPSWQNSKCQWCVACLNWCPLHAIQYGKKTSDHGRYINPGIRTNELFRD